MKSPSSWEFKQSQRKSQPGQTAWKAQTNKEIEFDSDNDDHQFTWVIQRCLCTFILGYWALPGPRLRAAEHACLNLGSMDRISSSSAHELCPPLSEPSSHTEEPEALHLSWGGWGLNAKSRCGSLGRTCLWALILRDKGTRQQKTPYVKTKIKSGTVLSRVE